MEIERLILKTKLTNIFNPNIIQYLCFEGYRMTGNKFWITFNGSKGYLSHLTISCEGVQSEECRLFGLFNKDGSVKKKMINIFHSEANGIRVSLGADKARKIKVIEAPMEIQAPPLPSNQERDDLPF